MNKNFSGPFRTGLDIQSRLATQAIPLTPTLIKPEVLAAQSGTLQYDPATGIITGVKRAVYATIFQFNVQVTGNTTFFFYAEIDNNGEGFLPNRYSGRQVNLTNATEGQIVMGSSNDFIEGLRFRFFFWASSASNLITEDLPNLAPGVATVPAVRILVAGS